jgi:hypothetical protein
VGLGMDVRMSRFPSLMARGKGWEQAKIPAAMRLRPSHLTAMGSRYKSGTRPGHHGYIPLGRARFCWCDIPSVTGHSDRELHAIYAQGIVNEQTQRVVVGIICIVLGASVCLIALDILPYDPDKIHAPDWVILLCGALFLCGGSAAMLHSHPLVVSVLGNAMVVAFASIAAWVALAGPAEQFSGELPFVSRELNVMIARIFFGLGSVMCALVLIPGMRQLLKLVSRSPRAGR